MSAIRVVAPDSRLVSEADATTGMIREQAVADEGIWVGEVRTSPNRPSGWHHHGDYDTYIYVKAGQVRFESGPNGIDVVEARPGDFIHVPPQVIHREVNPADSEGSVILMRVGSGPPVVNVDGPAPD